jgi:hypothetical protein
MFGMRRPSTTSLVISLIVMAAGITALWTGGTLFISGAATEAQTGNGSTMSGGIVLGLFGFFALITPVVTWVGRMFQSEHRKYSAWKQTLTPRERGWVNGGEIAALAGAAAGGYEANRAWARRIGDRYMEDQAAQAERDQLLMEAINGTGPASQPGTGGTPGQPGTVPEPTPGQYQPYASSWDHAPQGDP